MAYDPDQLRALAAAASSGTFEAAARVLHVTPSAISQRLKALEIATGRVLLVRSKPVRLTASGQVMLRLARQIELLTEDAAAELNGPEQPDQRTVIPLAVNADSLASWALAALVPVAGSVSFDLHREDQEHTVALLRDGTVMAAITTEAGPVPGCRVVRLGAMRYRPMMTLDFAAEWFPDGINPRALARAPVVVFDRKDRLQHRYLRRRTGKELDPPVHYVPSSTDYLNAVRLGLGWGMLPDLQSAPYAGAGEVVELDPRGALDVVLYWQQWRLRSPVLDRVAEAVLAAARGQLGQ